MEEEFSQESRRGSSKKRLDGDPDSDDEEGTEEVGEKEITVYEAIRLTIRDHLRSDKTERHWITSLQYWWSKTFNLPLKHPMLQEYTLEELAWEYFNRIERDTYEKEQIEEESDKIEIAKEKEAEDWADQMEKEEVAKVKNPAPTPVTIPNDDQAWMQDLLEQEKKVHGETFGEDIVEEF